MEREFITTTKKNRTIKALNLMQAEYNVYLLEKGYGLAHRMRKQQSMFGIDEYVYTGRFHKGCIKLVNGRNMSYSLPEKERYNFGFTLEGEADKIFQVRNALCKYNSNERRRFCYTNKKSELYFVGDPFKIYSMYVRIYDNCYGYCNNRWVVIYAETPNSDEMNFLNNGLY